MAVLSTPNASVVKVKFDHGTDLNGDRVIKTRTYTNVKFDASNDDIMAFVNTITSLQQHVLSGINRVDNTSISQ